MIRVGLPLLLFLRDTFPTRMSRNSSRRIKLNPEVRPHERAVRQFLDETAGKKPPALPSGCNIQFTWLEPSVMKELQIRERKAIQRQGLSELQTAITTTATRSFICGLHVNRDQLAPNEPNGGCTRNFCPNHSPLPHF